MIEGYVICRRIKYKGGERFGRWLPLTTVHKSLEGANAQANKLRDKYGHIYEYGVVRVVSVVAQRPVEQAKRAILQLYTSFRAAELGLNQMHSANPGSLIGHTRMTLQEGENLHVFRYATGQTLLRRIFRGMEFKDAHFHPNVGDFHSTVVNYVRSRLRP